MRTLEIKTRAQALLSASGIDKPAVNVEEITSDLGVELVVEPLEETVSGLLVVRKSRATIVSNQLHPRNRQRFSIAHELGHYVLHRYASNVFVDSTLTFYRDEKSADGVYRQEIEANSFAAELLMPEDFIRRHLGSQRVDLHDEQAVERLARDFGVSMQALTIRLVNLRLVTA